MPDRGQKLARILHDPKTEIGGTYKRANEDLGLLERRLAHKRLHPADRDFCEEKREILQRKIEKLMKVALSQ